MLRLHFGEFSVMKILESGMVVSPIRLKIIPTRQTDKLRSLGLNLAGIYFSLVGERYTPLSRISVTGNSPFFWLNLAGIYFS